MGWIRVADPGALAPGQCMSLYAEGKDLALYNVDGEYFCTDNSCPHRDGPLGEGDLEDGIVTCPWHAWQFDVRTGEALYNAGSCVRTYAVQLRDDGVYADLP